MKRYGVPFDRSFGWKSYHSDLDLAMPDVGLPCEAW